MKYRLREQWAAWERLNPDSPYYPLSWRKLATATGIRMNVLQRIEQGENTTVETLEKLAMFFGVRVSDLLDEGAEEVCSS